MKTCYCCAFFEAWFVNIKRCLLMRRLTMAMLCEKMHELCTQASRT